MTLHQFISYKAEIYNAMAQMMVIRNIEKAKSVEEWQSFINSRVTRVKSRNKVKYCLNYNGSGIKGMKSIIVLLKAKEDLGEHEDKMRADINTIDV